MEATASICTRVLSRFYQETPRGFPDCFERLEVKGILPAGLASSLASAARLRNLMVHRYWVVSDERVYRSVREGLTDFDEFIGYVKKFSGGRELG